MPGILDFRVALYWVWLWVSNFSFKNIKVEWFSGHSLGNCSKNQEKANYLTNYKIAECPIARLHQYFDVCEIWFAFSCLLDQLRQLCPVNCSMILNVLKEKVETPTQYNAIGKSSIDIFVSTADPKKEPPLFAANSILSILTTSRIGRRSCYVYDDGIEGNITEIAQNHRYKSMIYYKICNRVPWSDGTRLHIL